MVKEPRQTSFFHVGEVVDLWLVFGDVSRANKQAKQKPGIEWVLPKAN